MRAMKKSAGKRNERDDQRASPGPPSKRAIKYKGGYGPPPMYTKEQIREIYKRQDNDVAAAALKFLNTKMASEGKSEYKLVATHPCCTFRSKIGLTHHGNIVVKPSDDLNPENRLFFVECKFTKAGLEATICLDLGPADTSTRITFSSIAYLTDPARCHRSCRSCRIVGLKTPIFHPPGFKIGHLRF